MAKKLVMIRHGLVDVEFRNRFVGVTDVGLSAEGLKQAACLTGPIAKLHPVRCLASPLRRALETTRTALQPLGRSFEVVSALREIDFGDWEQKTFAEINAASPLAVERWSRFDPDFAFPGGEAVASFAKRVQTLARMVADDPAETVVVVTHGGVIRFLTCHFLGLDWRSYLLFNVEPASVSVISLYDQKGVLTGLNDLCHLEEGNFG